MGVKCIKVGNRPEMRGSGFSQGPKNAVSENLKKKIGPTTFDKTLVAYTRVYKLCSNVGVGIFAQSVFEKSPQQVAVRFAWRWGWDRDEGVNRSW